MKQCIYSIIKYTKLWILSRRVFVLDDEKILEIDSAESHTTFCRNLMPLKQTLKMVGFMLSIFTAIKKKFREQFFYKINFRIFLSNLYAGGCK